MSLILEALRKSEAERQVGRAPGLMTPMATPRRRSTAPLWMLAAALLVAGAGAGWWFGRPTTPDPAPALQPVPPAVDAAVPPPAGTDHTASQAIDPPRTPEPGPATPAPPVSTPPAAPVRLDPAPAPAPLPAPPAPESTAAAAPAAPPVAVLAPAPLPAPADVAPSVAASEAVAPPLEALPGLHAIDAERRGRLPPLRMSLHMYAEAVESRFVLIDGRRYAEGQVIEPGLEVAEIRRDGVVLAIDGRRVLLTSR
jgi:general secretion pathway protein B